MQQKSKIELKEKMLGIFIMEPLIRQMYSTVLVLVSLPIPILEFLLFMAILFLMKIP